MPLFLIACTGDYQAPVATSSVASTTKVAAPTKEVKAPLKKVSASKIETPVTPELSNDNHYTNTAGNEVHSPAYSSSVPAGASAICGDGTYSFSQSRRGTCSHHGGVREWLD